MKNKKDASINSTVFWKMAREYVDHRLPDIRKASPDTVKSYRDSLNRYIDYLESVKHVRRAEICFSDFNKTNLTDYLDWMLNEKKYAGKDQNDREVMMMKSQEIYQLKIKNISITPHILKKMLKIGFPAGVQSSMYTISNILIQTSINSFGTVTIAAWAAYGKIDVLFWMVISAFGVAVTTFAGQNYGAKKTDRVKAGMKISLAMAMATTIVLSVVFCIFCRPMYQIFTTESDVINEGVAMLRFLAPTYFTFVAVEILSGTIRGCGVSFVPMLISLFGICILRVVWILVAVPLRPVFTTVELSYPITWATTSLLYTIYYLSGRWQRSQTVLKKGE